MSSGGTASTRICDQMTTNDFQLRAMEFNGIQDTHRKAVDEKLKTRTCLIISPE